MDTFTKNFKYFSIFFLITALVFIPAIISAKIVFAETSVNQEINTLLSDYSNYLETGETSVKANYSPLMSKLVEERRTYYVEFFNKALHSTLANLKSEFGFDQARFSVDYEDIYTVRVSEKIRLQGEPKTKTPEDFPLILAAKWAITQTDDEREIFFLNQYIVSMETGVETSTANGVDITFVVQHEIVFEEHDGILIILNDTFSDKSNDNGEGFDKIAWTSQDFKRFMPDWRQFPDFEMYQVSIEEIGRTLLDQYRTISQNAYIQSPEFSYDPITAAEYIVQYTSNPDYYSYCSWEPHIVVDESFWNPAYQYLWDNEMMYCNDCADYVSQALSAGGLPIDDIWKPFMVPAWIRPRELMEYLVNANRGFVHENLWALQLGDLGFSEESGTWQHVVMISYVNPFLFSAHTSDRQNFTFSSVAFNKYMSIFRLNPEIVFLPIVKSESIIFVSNPTTIISIPYPQPPGSSYAAPVPYP